MANAPFLHLPADAKRGRLMADFRRRRCLAWLNARHGRSASSTGALCVSRCPFRIGPARKQRLLLSRKPLGPARILQSRDPKFASLTCTPHILDLLYALYLFEPSSSELSFAKPRDFCSRDSFPIGKIFFKRYRTNPDNFVASQSILVLDTNGNGRHKQRILWQLDVQLQYFTCARHVCVNSVA